MANHGPVYGLDAELAAKQKSSYDPGLQKKVEEYISSKIGHKFSSNFHGDLKDGVILCNLIRTVSPQANVPPPKKSNMPFVQMENIAAYLKGCSQIGMKTHDLFQTVDLFEAKNMNQVITNVLQLKNSKG